MILLNVRELRSSGLTSAGIRDAVGQAERWDCWMSAALLLVGPVAVVISMTRGGVLSMLVGAAATFAILGYTERPRRRADVAFIGLFAGVAVLVLLLAIGFNAAFDRIASLRHLEQTGGGRLEIIRDAINVWRNVTVGSAPAWARTRSSSAAFDRIEHRQVGVARRERIRPAF